jgi:hypothetical protein
MDTMDFSQEYYLQRATENDCSFSASPKTLNPNCREFSPKSFIYSGISAASAPPFRPKNKRHAKGEKKKVKKEVKGRRDGPDGEREWEWDEAELEVVNNVWEEDGGRSGSGSVEKNGRGSGDGDDHSEKVISPRNGVAVAGKPIAPRGKSWMIVTQKMAKCSY